MKIAASGARGTCLLCAAVDAVSETERFIDAEGKQYILNECTVCAAQYWEPLQNPGAAWYEHDTRYADRNIDPILKPNEKHIGVMRFLKDKKGSVLDVGCGVGNFLSLAKLRGWDCWGIDFDRDAIEAAKRTFGIPRLEVASLNEFAEKYPTSVFDLITFFDVFEHIDNHNEFLELVKRMLSPDGSIALSVPYRRGWRWVKEHDFPPRHLTRWDEASLCNILGRHGFTIVFTGYLPASLRFLIMKLRFKYGAWVSFGVVSRAKGKSVSSLSGVGKPTPARQSASVEFLHALAKCKDAILFGLPALFLWAGLFLTRKRYTDIFIVAKLVETA